MYIYIYICVVVHRIQWWRLCSTTHLWTRRWLRSPSPEAQSLDQWGHWKSVFVITTEDALQCLSLAAVSFWHRASSKLAAALWTKPCNLVCPWHIPPGLSDWCGTTGDWLWPCLYTAVLVYLDFFCRPKVPRTSGISASDTPPFESCVQPIKVGPWWYI